MKALDEVRDKLYHSEINCSISCFWDNGMDVKLGDRLRRRDKCAHRAAEAVEWLDQNARELYPNPNTPPAKLESARKATAI
jgi:hypothetical protein